MAWTEKLQSGKYRGGWWKPDGTKDYTKRATHPEHPYERKRDAFEAAQEEEVKARRQAAAKKGTVSASVTWGEWWDLLELAYPHSDADGVVQSAVRRYIRPRWGETPLNEIAQRDVKAWIADLSADKEPSYVARIYGVFQRSISLAMEREVLTASPCVGIKVAKGRKRKKAYTDEAYLEVIHPNLKAHYRALNTVGLDTGLRPGELCGLHADAIDLDGGWITVDRVLVARKRVIRHYPKDKDERLVPLTQQAIDVIRQCLAGRHLKTGCGLPHVGNRRCRSPLVFLNREGNVIIPDAWRHALERASEKIGVPARGPYTVRRGFATRAAAGGIDAFELAAIMGHADVRLTAEYVQQTPGARDRLRAALGERTGLVIVQGQQLGQSGAETGAKSSNTSPQSATIG